MMPILTKIMLVWQLFVLSSYTKFHEMWQTVQSVIPGHRWKCVWPPPKVFFSLLCKECLMKTNTTSHMLQDMRIEVWNTSHTLVVAWVIKLTVSRHKESKQAENNMQTSCQAMSCSVAKLSTNMSKLNKTCSAWQPQQVVQFSLGHFELDVSVMPTISHWLLLSWKLHNIWHIRDSHCQHHQWQY